MVNSMLRMVMVIALLLGNFTLAPVSSWQIRSGELKFKVETKLNKPIDEKLAGKMGSIADFGNLSGEFDIKFKTEADLKKLEMQCDMLLSNNIDEPVNLSCWGKFDFTDKNIPKTLFIFKHPNDDKYNFINIQFPSVNKSMTALGMFTQVLNADMINSINSSISDSLEGSYFNLEENDGIISAVMDEDMLKKVIKQIVLSMSEYIFPYFGVNMMTYNNPSVIGSSDGPTSVYVSNSVVHREIKLTTKDEINAQFEAAISEFFAKFDTVKLFSDNALDLNITLDDKELPKNINYAVNINTNLYDLIKAFDGYIGEGLSKENSGIDGTITFDYVFDKINEDVLIEYPNLTGENAIEIMPGNSMPDIDISAVNIVLKDELKQLKNTPFIKDNIVYIPIREALNLQGVANENIIWDDGTVTVKNHNYDIVLKVDSDELKVGEYMLKTGTTAILQGDTTYIPETMLGGLGIGGITNAFFDEEDNIIGCVVSVYNYIPRNRHNVRFSIQSDIDPIWEKYIYNASDMAGAKIDVVQMPTEQYLEQTNLIIASGDPSVMIGRYSDEFIDKMIEMNAIYPAIKVDDRYSIIIPKVINNTDVVFKVIESFIEMVNIYE